MWTCEHFPQRGWRRTGGINAVFVIVIETILVACFAVSISKRESSSISSTKIFEGSCERAPRLNTILHLILNIISTGILASSNFFMQIVTSPSRKEIDQAHAFLRSLKIGLQSPTNIPALSRTKQICWAILLVSSIPIHLFFNSSIYSTAYQSLQWNVTIATSHFARNGVENQTFWLPGASLAVSGSSSPVQRLESDHAVLNSTGERILGFGNTIAGGYWNQTWNEDVRREIAATAKHCADWVKMSPELCMDEYRPYKFHTKFKNVVLIVLPAESGAQGWTRKQVFELSVQNLTDSWDPKVPPDEMNSLWFWTPCTLLESPRSDYNNDYVSGSDKYRDTFKKELEAYDHSCGRLFGLNTSQPPYSSSVNGITPLSFIYTGITGNTTADELSNGYNAQPGIRNLQIDYCLAERASCQVRVSNTLILIVIVCVLIKIITCVFLLFGLMDVSLVTPGDAIESFISSPDPVTKGLGTLTLSTARDLECQPRKVYSTFENPRLTFTIRPRRWKAKTHRLHSAVDRGIWAQVYYPIFLALVAVLVAVIFSSMSSGLKTFGRSENYSIWDMGTNLGYVASLIIVNMPQVMLSFMYLTINTLYTQLQVEQELNSYGREYTALRVSYPVGEQTSTYRLQLPFKYSVPLISLSILLHWIASNSLFLFVVEGGAGGQGQVWSPQPDLAKNMGVAWNAVIAIGYSGLSILIFFCTGLVIALSPLFLRSRRLQNDMVVGGTNSLVLSAACHIPMVSRTSRRDSISDISPARNIDREKEYLQEVVRGKVRWGAMPLPLDIAAKIEVDDDEPVMHLGFGTEDHDVQAPQTGMLYA